VEYQRRVVSLPKKQDTALLSNTFNAEKQLNNLTRLENNEVMKQMYHDHMLNYNMKGRDGQLQMVVLQTSDGYQITCPIQLVIPLEVDQGGEDVGNS
jgi:hypothetical protein